MEKLSWSLPVVPQVTLFDWSNNAFDGQQEPTNMPAGDYTVTVTDLNGCTASASIEIEEPAPITLAVSTEPTDCFAGSDGSIDLSVSGGTAPYTYDWNNGTYDVEDPTNVNAGPYVVVVTDDNGCTAVINAVVDQPTQLIVNIDEISSYGGFNLTCYDATDGSAKVSGSGGTPPYTYAWSNGANGETITDLTAGTYVVTISDGNGCTSEEQVALTAPEQINGTFSIEEPSCYGENDGRILVDTVLGGTAPYVYAINGTSFTSFDQFNNLLSDTYEVTIQDANGCEWSEEISVDQPSELIVDLGDDIELLMGDSVQLEPIANITQAAIDTFFWQRSEITEYEPWVKPIETTDYSIFMIDEFGCVASDDILVRVKKERLVYIPNTFSPNGDDVNDYFNIYVGTGVKVVKSFRVYTRWGEVMFSRSNFVPAFEQEGWDGKFRDEMMNPAVFVYMAEVEFIDGRVEVYQGDVTLTR